MNVAKITGLVVGGIVIACIAFFVGLFLVKVLWAWTAPYLFPGAVQPGLIAGSISWSTSAKIAFCVAVISVLLRNRHVVEKKD